MPRRLAAGAPRTPTRHESSAPHSAGRSAVSPCRGAACTRPGRRGRRTRYSHWSSAQPKERSGEPTNGISCGRARKLGRDGCAVPLNWPTEALSHAKFSMHSYVSPRGRGIHALTPQHCARRSRPPGPPQPPATRGRRPGGLCELAGLVVADGLLRRRQCGLLGLGDVVRRCRHCLAGQDRRWSTDDLPDAAPCATSSAEWFARLERSSRRTARTVRSTPWHSLNVSTAPASPSSAAQSASHGGAVDRRSPSAAPTTSLGPSKVTIHTRWRSLTYSSRNRNRRSRRAGSCSCWQPVR